MVKKQTIILIFIFLLLFLYSLKSLSFAVEFNQKDFVKNGAIEIEERDEQGFKTGKIIILNYEYLKNCKKQENI